MFSSIRARIVALCVAIVVVALAANAVLNYVVANSYNTDAINSSLNAVESGHVDGISESAALVEEPTAAAAAVTQFKLS
ncbi:hypothetical protein PQR27_14225 [Paraburkholderia fungorum]